MGRICTSGVSRWVVFVPVVVIFIMANRKKVLTSEEIQQLLEQPLPSDLNTSSEGSDSDQDPTFKPGPSKKNDVDLTSEDSDDEDKIADVIGIPSSSGERTVLWSIPKVALDPRLSLSQKRSPAILNNALSKSSTELDIFLQIFPKSLFMFIAQCTNTRLQILGRNIKKQNITVTDYEITHRNYAAGWNNACNDLQQGSKFFGLLVPESILG